MHSFHAVSLRPGILAVRRPLSTILPAKPENRWSEHPTKAQIRCQWNPCRSFGSTDLSEGKYKWHPISDDRNVLCSGVDRPISKGHPRTSKCTPERKRLQVLRAPACHHLRGLHLLIQNNSPDIFFLFVCLQSLFRLKIILLWRSWHIFADLAEAGISLCGWRFLKTPF
jgi:hypothetical protein